MQEHNCLLQKFLYYIISLLTETNKAENTEQWAYRAGSSNHSI